MKRSCLATLTIAAALASACASPPPVYKAPVAVEPPSGKVAVDQAVTLFDASGSQVEEFSEGKATLESLVGAMPDGGYDAGLVTFGGFEREETGVAPFDRAKLAAAAKDASFLQGSTPLYHVLENEVASAVGDGSGRAAVVLISDGVVTDFAGRTGVGEDTLVAAREVIGGRTGETCFHTVQSGNDPAGAALLQSLSELTPCGSFRNASTLSTPQALQQFSRDVYLSGAAPPAPATPVAATMLPDSDGDGVVDPRDECPNTLKKARVDSRGCWTLSDLQFAVNGAAIEVDFTTRLRQDIEVLKANPDVRIRVDGHTDSDGSKAFNQQLSEQRAAAVRDFLVTEGGLDAERFEIKGFGESAPVAPNDSAANKRRNRRVELTILD